MSMSTPWIILEAKSGVSSARRPFPPGQKTPEVPVTLAPARLNHVSHRPDSIEAAPQAARAGAS